MRSPQHETVLDGTNLESKIKVDGLAEIRDRIVALRGELQGTERQVDHYFDVPVGRMKLRQSSRDGAHLIVYLRPEEGAVRASRFHRLPVSDPDGLCETLTAMVGETAVVEKTREVWWWRDVRIHLDDVRDHGTFVEFEARLDRIGDEGEARRRVDYLCDALALEDGAFVNGSYGEMRC